jgi:Putative glutamine amidotransferase
MRQLATATGGKYYFVRNNKSLPKIYQREVRRVAMPLVHNGDTVPQVVRPEHEIVSGVPSMPVIHGYVRTTPKDHPLVELIGQAPDPAGSTNPILAAWTYGLGRTVCFTTDTGDGKGWAADWLKWDNYDRLFEQIVRWSMRPSGDEQNYSVVTEMLDDKVRVIVTALDKDDNPENRLNVSGLAVDPESKAKAFSLKQVAPGRYVGEFEAKDVGSYMVVLSPGAGKGTLRAGVNVPYSAEFRSRETNVPLLTQMAGLAAKDGQPGEVIDVPANESADAHQAMEDMLKINSFRHDLPKAHSSQDAWHYLVVVAAILFFCDVFVRRVQIGFDWVAPLARRVIGRQEEAAPSEYLARLRSRKEEVGEEIEAKRAAARFEPQPDAPVTDDDIVETAGPAATGQPPPVRKSGPSMAAEQEEESYTDRLLKAKKKALEEERKKKQE